MKTKKTKNESTSVKADKSAPTQAKPRTFQEVRLTEIRINPLNPRKNFSGPKYDELLASVRSKGVIVPLLLRPLSDNAIGKVYEIIAGERRFRAACEAAKESGSIENARIPAIVQEMTDDDAYDCMTVENLQREDLTPLEEARAFKLYLDRKGPDALQELAERTGINPCYIRRRTAILTLPEKILKSWEDGDIAHGHLEQLVRVSDRKEQTEFYDMAIRQDWSVKILKERIESRTPKLACALFLKDVAGCPTCPKNTDVQRNLFGEDVATKALCLDPDCYRQHQECWIDANWPKFKSSRKLETNGARFREATRWDEHHNIYRDVQEKCRTCEHFLSIITLDGKVDDKISCLGPKKCHETIYNPKSSAARKAADPNAPHVPWHGRFFREKHYEALIPALETHLPDDDPRILRVILLTMLEGADSEILKTFARKYDEPKNIPKETWHQYETASAWRVIEQFDAAKLMRVLRETAVHVLLDGLNITSQEYHRGATSPLMRHLVACHLGADLQKDWRMNEDYLDKKTTKEIHAIAAQFDFFKDDKAKAYLYEKLGKKRDRFDLCKKAELVKVILESGIDLAGKVPAEILHQ